MMQRCELFKIITTIETYQDQSILSVSLFFFSFCFFFSFLLRSVVKCHIAPLKSFFFFSRKIKSCQIQVESSVKPVTGNYKE